MLLVMRVIDIKTKNIKGAMFKYSPNIIPIKNPNVIIKIGLFKISPILLPFYSTILLAVTYLLL